MKSAIRLSVLCTLILGLSGCGDESVVTADATSADTSITDTQVEDTAPAGPCDGKTDGDSCDDGDPCTLDDICSAGECVGGSNDPCESDSTCQTGTCVAGEGCKYENAEDGTECSVTCFDVATCIEGDCKADAASAVVCATPEEAGKPCLEELQCDLETGACTVEIFKPEGTACDDDGNFCSKESCSAEGECVSTGDVEKCSQQSSDFPCLKWACDAKDGECKDTGFIGEVSCDDGNACTKNDTCSEDEFGIAECVGEAIPVDDGNPCTDDYCDENGEFFHDFLPGASCDTGDACSPLGTCEGTNADDGYCKFDGCECNTDADCEQAGDLCAGQSYCDKTGDQPACKVAPETVVVCPLGDKACHVNTCVPETGLCTSVPVDDGVLCDDGDACSVGDICQDGLCEVGKPLECDDDLFCNGVETCDPVKGCTNGAPPKLDDGIECTKDSCDEEADAVVHTPSNGLCDDADACNGEETCDLEGCVAGKPINVDDGDECTLDSCMDGKVVNEPIANCGLSPYYPDPGDQYGSSIATHGSLIAIGAPGEDSCDTDTSNNKCPESGAVLIYNYDYNNKVQQQELKAVLKGPDPVNGAKRFGTTVHMSENWVAVGSIYDASCGYGVNPANTEQSPQCAYSGAVFLYKKTDNGWEFHSWLKAPNNNIGAPLFSRSLLLTEGPEGNVSLMVGAPNPLLDENANIKGGGGQAKVYLYHYNPLINGDEWMYATSLSDVADQTLGMLNTFGLGSSLFGWSISFNGEKFAIGAPYFELPNTDIESGLVVIASIENEQWKFETLLPKDTTYNQGDDLLFGYVLAFYKDTNTLAIGAPGHSSCDTYSGQDVDAVFSPDANAWQCPKSGAVYLYGDVNDASSIENMQEVVGPADADKIFKAPNTHPNADFGRSLSWIEVPKDIDNIQLGLLTVGSPGEASCNTYIDQPNGHGGEASDTECPDSGATYVFWDQSMNGPLQGFGGLNNPAQGYLYQGMGYSGNGLGDVDLGQSRFGETSTTFSSDSLSTSITGAPGSDDLKGMIHWGALSIVNN